MRRTLRLAACSAAFVGLTVLSACESAVPTANEARPEGAAPAEARTAKLQQNRLRDAGRAGLRPGVNFVTPPEQAQRAVLDRAPEGFTRPASAPRFEVRRARFGEQAHPGAERMAAHRARGGDGYFEGTAGSGSGSGDVSAQNHEPWSYGGASYVDIWFWGDYIDFSSYTWASKNISYLDVIGDSYADGWYLTTLYHYAYNSSFAGAWWTYYAYWYGYANWYTQYGDHFVYDDDGYGTFWHNFFTSYHAFSW